MSILTLLMIVGILAMLVFNFVLVRGGREELERRTVDDAQAAAAAERERVDAAQRLHAARELVELESQTNRLIEQRVALRDRERAAEEIAAPPPLDLAARFEERRLEVSELSREMQQIYWLASELGERLGTLPSYGDRPLDTLLRRGLPNWWLLLAGALSRNEPVAVARQAARAQGLQQALRAWLQRPATGVATGAGTRVLIEIRDDLERIVRTAREIETPPVRASEAGFGAASPAYEATAVEAVSVRAARAERARPAAMADDGEDLAEGGSR